MKEMIYEYERGQPAFVLDRGYFLGYEYLVISLGRHPCAYVCVDANNQYYGKHYDDIHIECHGGVTFAEPTISFLEYSEKYKCMVRTSIKDKWIIGWDYAHYGDYSVFDRSGKKWTTQELKNECEQVIKQLITQENNRTQKQIKEMIQWANNVKDAYTLATKK